MGVSDNRPIALKRLRRDLPSRSTTTIAAKDLGREVSILSRIKQHDHIIRLEAVGEEREGRPFVVLERLTTPFPERIEEWRRLEGRLLPASWSLCCGSCVKGCARRRISLWATRLGVGRDLASALAHLHTVAAMPSHRVVYRDLKPGNLGFDGDRLVLFDFGLAKLLPVGKADGPAVQMTPETGSVRYMSPEVAQGRWYDQSCDIYSFGILLWQMLSLETPFAHMTPAMHHRQVVVGNERPPFRRKWPESLISLLTNCWAPNPRSRVSADYAYSALDRTLIDHVEMLI